MTFKKVRITKRTSGQPRARKLYKKPENTMLKKFIIYAILGFFGICLLGVGIIYFSYIRPLPNIKKLEEMNIKEASVIYDKNGKELYTLFGDEKRTYVPYEKISKNMVNAIVSGEDKTFFENKGVDIKGLFRALINYLLQKSDKIEGTSTISQQLIRNVFLTNERKLERKIKELYLSYAMTKNYTKEKILELYLNKISFGSNAFGIEQASLTFFGKNAINLNILEASIMASIPKGPTYYSPYNHYDRVVGYLYTFPKEDDKAQTKIISKETIKSNSGAILSFTNIISKLEAKRLGDNGLLLCGVTNDIFKKKENVDKDGCTILNYSDLLGLLNNIRIEDNGDYIEYQTGRKDYMLGRMLEDNKITFDEYKKSLIDSIGFQFKLYTEKIKAPHFVFYVKEFLSQKYGEQILEEGGLKIYTTLDSVLQEKAEQLVKDQVAKNFKSFDANNAALLSIDNKTGDILAYVGGADYFNKDIDGNVNMLLSKRQPGSTFKPIVYGLAIDKNPISPHTPIYDLPTTFPGGYKPNNYNGKFEGKMTIMTALDYSRNIPALKAYFLAGEQTGIISYLKTVGVKSLNENFSYGAPLAIGTGEMTPMELAYAYTVFANMGNKVEINPIKKILDSKGLVIEEKKQSFGKNVLDEKTAYIMNYILSATYSRPSDYWNVNLALNDRQACAKTGTSNKLFNTNGKKQILPGDLWTAGYTPQITTIVWAGNTDGKAIKGNGDGLNGAAPIWKNFMEFALKDKEKLTWTKPKNLNYVKISKISGYLAPEGFQENLTVESLFKNIPKKYDTSLNEIEVDSMCNGKVGPNTPASAIKKGYYVAFNDIDARWQSGVDKWVQDGGAKDLFPDVPNIITNYSDSECLRDQNAVDNSSIQVGTKIKDSPTFVHGNNYVEVGYKSNNPIVKIQFLIGENVIDEKPIDNKTSGIFKGNVFIPDEIIGENTLTVRAIDNIYYSKDEVNNITVIDKDTIPPEITITNPTDGKIAIYPEQFFNLRGTIKDLSLIKTTNMYIDDKLIQAGITGKEFVISINEKNDLTIGTHKIKIESIDNNFNKGYAEVDLEILAR